jgi:hypothetical protein
MRCHLFALALGVFVAGEANAQLGSLFGEKKDNGKIGQAANLLGGWTNDPLNGRPRPTIDNRFWQSDPLTGQARPTMENRFWQSDPLTGQVRPTMENRFWQSDPLTGQARPTMENRFWQSDPLTGQVRPTMENRFWQSDPFNGIRANPFGSLGSPTPFRNSLIPRRPWP